MPMNGQGPTATSVTSEQEEDAQEPPADQHFVNVKESLPLARDADSSSVGSVDSNNTWDEEHYKSPVLADLTSNHIVKDIVQSIEQGNAEASSSLSQSQAARPPVSPRI